jgi:uncharacterized membrane protein YkvI
LALLVIGLIILFFIVLILVLPVHVEVIVTVRGGVDYRLRAFYLFRLIVWEWGKQPAQKKENQVTAKEKRGHITWSSIYKVVQVSGLWNSICLLIKRLAHATKLRKLESDLTISLGDDYYTGMFIGLLLPVVIFLNTQLSSVLRIVPAFEEDLILDGSLTGLVAVRPIRILAPMTAFIFSQPVWKAAWIIFRDK